ncbi:MAG: Ig-like domain-containing protein [Candidatus Sericytochromatia bacterium]
MATGSGFSASYNGLSDKPEVTMALPSRSQKNVAPNTAFVLTFSEPMDHQGVENNFAIRSFVSRKISVDVQSGGDTFNGTVPIQREYQSDAFKTGETLPRYGNLNKYQTGTPIFDSSAFDISWNADDTQATFAFKPGKALPTDKDLTRLPIYTLAFDSFGNHQRSISDKNGVARSEKHFKLTDGDFEEALAFEVQADTSPPRLEKAAQLDLPMRAVAFSLNFSEPMLLKTHSLNIAGGMADTPVSCKQAPAGFPGAQVCTPARAAENYTITVKASNGQIKYQGPWSQMGGEAHFDLRDPSFKTVILSASSLQYIQEVSDHALIEAASSLTDPAGNALSPESRHLLLSLLMDF